MERRGCAAAAAVTPSIRFADGSLKTASTHTLSRLRADANAFADAWPTTRSGTLAVVASCRGYRRQGQCI